MRVRLGVAVVAAAMLAGQPGAAPARVPGTAAKAKAADDGPAAGGATWVLMACGFGLLGAGMRARRPGFPMC